MLRFHRQKEALGTLLLHRRANSNSIVEMDEASRITRFLERPTLEERPTHNECWVNSGVCILNREIFPYIPETDFSDLPKDVFAQIYEEASIYGHPLTSYRCAVDSAKRYEEAEAAVLSGRCRVNIKGEN